LIRIVHFSKDILQAPKGLWLNANYYRGALPTLTPYPEGNCTDSEVPGLTVKPATLLNNYEWALFKVAHRKTGYQQVNKLSLKGWCT
jgi:hypothetical protein